MLKTRKVFYSFIKMRVETIINENTNIGIEKAFFANSLIESPFDRKSYECDIINGKGSGLEKHFDFHLQILKNINTLKKDFHNGVKTDFQF